MKLISDYFDLSKREQKAMFLLLTLILVILGLRLFLPVSGLSEEELQILAHHRNKLKQQLDQNAKDPFLSKPVYSGNTKTKPTLYFFDPNTVTEKGMLDLGFKEWQIKNIVNYRNAGGKFQEPLDLKKLYSFKNGDYQKYLPFVRITGVEANAGASPRQKNWSAQEKLLQVELNSADTTELKKLKGIGSYFAKRIVAFRDKLGGFVSVSQLLEVYHFTPEMFAVIKANIRVEPSLVRKMNLNKASVDDLRKHPYLSWKTANAIVKYREQHGRFTAIKEISNSVLIGDSLCSKIAPYFALDDQ